MLFLLKYNRFMTSLSVEKLLLKMGRKESAALRIRIHRHWHYTFDPWPWAQTLRDTIQVITWICSPSTALSTDSKGLCRRGRLIHRTAMLLRGQLTTNWIQLSGHPWTPEPLIQMYFHCIYLFLWGKGVFGCVCCLPVVCSSILYSS